MQCSKRFLKELYTSISTLAEKLVLTPMNNKFFIQEKNRYSSMQKNHINLFSLNFKRGLLSGSSALGIDTKNLTLNTYQKP